MSDDNDFDLRSDQWELLKALRAPGKLAASRLMAIDDLLALGLVTMTDQVPALTPEGRKALIRGSFSLLDAAA
jgi:hypothetical protein